MSKRFTKNTYQKALVGLEDYGDLIGRVAKTQSADEPVLSAAMEILSSYHNEAERKNVRIGII